MNKKPIILNIIVIFILITVALTQASFAYSNFKSDQSSIMFHEHILPETVSGAFSVHSADIDGDGDMDIVATASGEDKIKWWENKGNNNFVEHLVIASFDAWAVYAIDLDKDNHTDILGGASNHGDIVWIENDGDESFTWNAAHYIDKTFGGVRSIYADDIDKDGDIDVLGAAQLNDDISWWENDGYQNFERHIISDSFHGAFSIYSTDVDGDGHVDVLAAANDGQKFSWWENDGSQNFSEHVLKSDMGYATSIFASDVDGDGDMDILGAVRQPGIIFWWENDGNQFFTEHTLKSLDGLCSVHAADMDGDGDVDIIGAANDDGNIFLWENDGDENFREILVSTMGFLSANYVFPSDLNGDGKMDIISAGFASDTVAYWTLFVGSDFVYLPLIVNGQKELPTNPPSAPTLNDISNDDGDGSYQISWNPVVGASTYTLEEADNSTFTGASTIYSGGNTFYPISGKAAGTYYYRVRATNIIGTSSWSNTKSAIVSNTSISITLGDWAGETNQETSLSFTVTNDSGYVINSLQFAYHATCTYGTVLRIESLGDGQVVNNHFSFGGVSGDFTSSTAVSGTFTKSFNDPIAGYCSASGTWAANPVTTPASPTLNNIDNTDGDGDYDISWNNVDNANSYALEEADNSDFTNAIEIYNGGDTSYSVSGKSVGTYYYRVRATNSAGESNWSSTESAIVTDSGFSITVGAWSGTTSQGTALSFTVSDESGYYVKNFLFSYRAYCTYGTVVRTENLGDRLIVDNHFSYSGISGDFTSPTEASGTFSKSFNDPVAGYCSGSGTWTAAPSD